MLKRERVAVLVHREVLEMQEVEENVARSTMHAYIAGDRICIAMKQGHVKDGQ